MKIININDLQALETLLGIEGAFTAYDENGKFLCKLWDTEFLDGDMLILDRVEYLGKDTWTVVFSADGCTVSGEIYNLEKLHAIIASLDETGGAYTADDFERISFALSEAECFAATAAAKKATAN